VKRAALILFVSSVLLAQDMPPPPPPAAPAVVPEVQIDHANDLYQHEDYSRAIVEYQRFLDLFPNNPQAMVAQYRLGECHRELGDKESAEKQFTLVIKRYPNTEVSRRSIYRLGEMRYLDGKHIEAVEILAPLLSKKDTPLPLRNGAAYYSAKSLVEQKKWAEAEKILDPISKSKNLEDLGPYILELMGRIYQAQSKNSEALAVWEEALKAKVPDSLRVDLLLESASLRLETGDVKGALSTFAELQKQSLAPEYAPAAVVGYLRAAYRAEQYKRITSEDQKLYKRMPEEYRAEASYLIGSAHRRSFQWEPAVAWFEKHLKEFPDSPYSENAAYEALACYGAVNEEKALQKGGNAFLSAHPNSPMAVNVHYLVAESCFKDKKFADALAHYDEVARKADNEEVKADAYYKKAWSLQSLGQKDNAQKAFVEFAELYPKNDNADDSLYMAATVASEQARWDESVKLLGRLIEQYPQQPFTAALFEMAMAQGRLKDLKAMEVNLKSFLERYPKHSRQYEANYWLGWLATQRKEWDQALRYLNAAAKKQDTPFYDEVRQRRAVVYYYLGRVDDTQTELAYFAAQGRIKEQPLEVIRWTAQKQLDLFRYPPAVDAYRWYLESAKTRVQISDAQMGLARAHAGKKSWGEAIAAYKKVITSEGNTDLGMEARLGAVRAIIEKGDDLDPAQRYVNEVLTERPEGLQNARARLLQGDILVVQKKDKEAAAQYYTVSVLFDNAELSPWAMKLASEAFERAGDMMEAKRVRDELAKKYPKASPEAPKTQ
jgi:TolA-binding protein